MIPHHVAIIMDGNRRWARQRRFDVLQGHSKGSDTLKNISKKAHEMGVSFLTVFAFSSENWRRPKFEVDGLLKLMKRYLMQDLETLIKDNIKLRIIGDLSAFEPELRELFQDAIARTASNTGLNLSIAVNYGGQQDIVSAVKKLQALNLDDISVDDVKAAMQTNPLPKVDLLIRTGGEQRLSNFLLWDCAYAELHFSDKFWPDFSAEDLDYAVQDYEGRDRRFGGDSVIANTPQKA